jgi:HK97 family phage portal protein
MGFISKKFEKRSTLANPSQYLKDFFAGTFGVINSAGVTINEQNADSCVAFGACVDRISKTIAMLPLDVYKRNTSGRAKATGYYLYDILKNNPNQDMTSFLWRLVQSRAYLTHGVCYSKIEFDDQRGTIKALLPIPPNNVRPMKSKFGKLYFEVYNDELSAYTILDSDEIFRVYFNTDDGITPKSPVRTYAESIGLSIATERFGARFFGSGANMAGVLMHPGNLDAEGDAFANLRKSWDEVYSGINNSHKVVILEEGMKYEKIGIPPEEAQFLETRKFQAQEIARIFDMPLDRIQASYGDSSTYANAEHRDLEFMKFTMLPHTINWQQAIAKYLITDSKTYYAEFNFDIVLKTDTATRSQFYHQMVGDGIMNADEVREKENMPSQKDKHGKEGIGKKYYIPAQVMEKSMENVAEKTTEKVMKKE